mmetsp:Transcript_2627/g.3498  ORF Transcript_2627/g.3498 Transcript_2627/m.3498 type:complete len:202 (+) Transcript_2627:23-628(+)
MATQDNNTTSAPTSTPEIKEKVIPKPHEGNYVVKSPITGEVYELVAPSASTLMENPFQHNCLGMGIMGLIGGAIGGFLFGTFLSATSFSQYDATQSTMQSTIQGFKEMGRAGISTAKNLAVFGAVLSTSECTLETIRGKSDVYNDMAASCFSGGILSYRGGSRGMAMGCVGMTGLGLAFDYFLLHRHLGGVPAKHGFEDVD